MWHHERPSPGSPSGDAVVKCVFLHIVCPCGRRHAAVGVQQNAETSHNQKAQENEEKQYKDESCLLLKGEERDGLSGPRRRQRAAVEVLRHPQVLNALCNPRTSLTTASVACSHHVEPQIQQVSCQKHLIPLGPFLFLFFNESAMNTQGFYFGECSRKK